MRKRPRLEYAAVLCTSVLVADGCELRCVESDLRDLGELNDATGPYSYGYDVAVHFDKLTTDDRPLVVLLLEKVARQLGGEVVVLRDGFAVLAHALPLPPAEGSVVREPRRPHPPTDASHANLPTPE